MATTPQPLPRAAEPGQIRWPEAYQPGSAAVFLHNELIAKAPLPAVWAWLLRAGEWNHWHRNASAIHFLSHTGPDLRNRSRFRWKSQPFPITSKVLEFEPPPQNASSLAPSRIAWDSHAVGFDAWHTWLLTPLPNGGTHILSQEVHRGWLARLSHRLLPGRTQARQQLWLEALARQAEAGPPPVFGA